MGSLYDQQIPTETDPLTGLPIGPRVSRSQPAVRPQRIVLEGRYCRLEPIDPHRHSGELFTASTPPDAAARFRYLADSPPRDADEMTQWAQAQALSDDPLVFVVIDRATSRVEGRQTYMRIAPEHQCIEIGNIYWGPSIAGTRVATEANYLFACYALETLGYRRYEWKCDALNAPSRRAAKRFGFRYEGHFRRAVIIKGRSRDTTWFSIIDEEWPALKAAYEQWLSPENFDDAGIQRQRLSDLTAAALVAS